MTNHILRTLFVVSIFINAACAGKTPIADIAPPPPAQTPAVTPPPATPVPVENARPSEPTKDVAPTPTPPQPKSWTLKKGKLSGGQPSGKIVSSVKNEKTSGKTIETCWNYGSFSIFELKSTDEVGAAELAVRTPAKPGEKLCEQDFKGKTLNLRIIEGFFAGVAGNMIVVDGADSSEGMLDFQLLSLETGKEIFKSAHHPAEDVRITPTSVEYYAKVKVACELPTEGAACWNRVIEDNKFQKKTRMPDCKATFAKKGKALTEPALVTVPAKVASLSAPKVVLVGGRATCDPEP